MAPLPPEFFQQDTLILARQLLGCRLCRRWEGQLLSGRIVETEGYRGRDDQASHSHRGPTARNAPMWEAPGRAYTYLIHGKYYLLNLVTEAEGQPGAVLLRAIEPLEGLEVMAQHRAGRPRHEWTSGPGRLTLALHIGAGENRVDMRGPESGLWIEGDMSYPDEAVSRGPRIGMGKNLPEPWLSAPLRWWVSSHPDVSRGK